MLANVAANETNEKLAKHVLNCQLEQLKTEVNTE